MLTMNYDLIQQAKAQAMDEANTQAYDEAIAAEDEFLLNQENHCEH